MTDVIRRRLTNHNFVDGGHTLVFYDQPRKGELLLRVELPPQLRLAEVHMLGAPDWTTSLRVDAETLSPVLNPWIEIVSCEVRNTEHLAKLMGAHRA